MATPPDPFKVSFAFRETRCAQRPHVKVREDPREVEAPSGTF